MRTALSLAAVVWALLTAAAWAAERPNIIVMLADDLGWADASFNGGDIATPNLDRMRSQGVAFTRFYANTACTPTRVSLLTGRHAFRSGMHGDVIRWYHRHGLPVEERTLADYLRGVGYATHAVGKWHLGHADRAYWPTNRGFDSFFGHLGGHIDYLDHTWVGAKDWRRDMEPVIVRGYSTDLIAAEARRIIGDAGRYAGKPYFMYIAFNAPHAPGKAPPEDVRRHAVQFDEPRRTYAAVVEALDRAVGGIMAAVADSPGAANTLVVFLSDNGADTVNGGNSGTLRSGKGSVYEGGLRVPAVAWWPARIPAASTVSAPVRLVDLTASLLSIAGSGDAAQPRDGRDFGEGLFALPEATGDNDLLLLYWERPGKAAAVKGRIKLVVDDGDIQTFDLRDDPGEAIDVSEEFPDARREFEEMVRAIVPAARRDEPRPWYYPFLRQGEWVGDPLRFGFAPRG